MTCNCLVELKHVFFDKTFTYKVPSNMEKFIKVGMRVLVPFGGRTLEAFVISLGTNKENIELKEVIKLIDQNSVLNKELLDLGTFMKNITLSSLMSCYSAMLPKALKAKNTPKIKIKKEKYVYINEKINLDDLTLNKTQTEIIKKLGKNKLLKKDLELISKSSLSTLIKKEIILIEEKEVYRHNIKLKEKQDFILNNEQKLVFDKVSNFLNINKTFLLFGVTGSGKTNVYMKLIEKVINQGKTAIFLVPEISLTPQIIDKFTSYFERIACLHSRLSEGEKYDEWRKINEGKVDVVIGARSAIFAPLKNIGIIIIDEEHTSSYKQENNPRYNAAEIAKWRSQYHKCPLILGSATPKIESYTRALKGDYELLTLKNRYNNTKPSINIIDMNKEFRKNNDYFSNKLIEEIKNVLNKNEQAILFLNKRGYSSIVVCPNCGHTEKCPNCDIAMTYHKSSNMLRCHYCGYALKKEKNCQKCNEEYKEFGFGTEKAVESLKKFIPDARIVRMDVDTTTGKNSHEKIIKDFREKKYDILLGTQMIAKGLDFENVTLVGALNADISLNIPDFRSSEVTFELLNQVSGRSGRGKKEGKVFIQTFNPDHYAIRHTLNSDYVGFYKEEMEFRKKLYYPPFCNLCLIRVISKDYEVASLFSNKIGDYLKKSVNEVVIGPSLANVFKMNNEYRFQMIIKYKNVNNIRKVLMQIVKRFYNDKKVRVEVDLDPIRL